MAGTLCELGRGRFDHESWRLTGLGLRVKVEEFRVLIDWVSAGSLAKLKGAIDISPEPYYLEEEGEEDNDLETFDLSTMSRFRLLSHLSLDGKVSGDASSLQNLTQLQHLELTNTLVWALEGLERPC